MVSKGKWHIFIFQASWVSNIEAVISHVRDKTTTSPTVKYILTNRLTQDCAENTFSVSRNKNAHNINPTPQQLRYIVQEAMVDRLLQGRNNQNCVNDLETFLFQLSPTSTQSRPQELYIVQYKVTLQTLLLAQTSMLRTWKMLYPM